MATAKNDYETRQKRVTEKVRVTHLTLTTEEGEALRAVLGHVGGAQEDGRKHIDAIISALGAAGVRNNSFDVKPLDGGLYFQPKRKSDPYSFLAPIATPW